MVIQMVRCRVTTLRRIERKGLSTLHLVYQFQLAVQETGNNYVHFCKDNRGILFAWCEMTKEMEILGINKMKGLANYLYHPEKICVIIEETGELVPIVELKRRVMEKMAKKEMEKEKLAKEKRVTNVKR
ncbi:hypothetical protein C1645_741747 [Glomus cerebriforme]|uniref:Uncharacterized protein n=1 Tax=Glomus cerebriforme TaxID=658196 RepID=A0A397SQV8_9GLOM|nr:hypothetical protein C1645_741747 [Glomus cerebriforme]